MPSNNFDNRQQEFLFQPRKWVLPSKANLLMNGEGKYEGYKNKAEELLSGYVESSSLRETGIAKKLLTDILIIFGVGDDILDDHVSKSSDSRELMSTWNTIIKEGFLGSLDDKSSYVYPFESEVWEQYREISYLWFDVGRRLESLLINLPLKDRESARNYLISLFDQIIRGEQATFELVGELRGNASFDSYLSRVCVNGNTPAFLLVDFIGNLKNGKVVIPTSDEINAVDEMSKVWQIVDDLFDTVKDLKNSQPKAIFFALREMSSDEDREESGWYKFLLLSLDRDPSDEEYFMSKYEDLSIFDFRCSQVDLLGSILNEKKDILSEKQIISLEQIAETIDYHSLAIKIAQTYKVKIESMSSQLGKLCSRSFDLKMKKLLSELE
ncbi:hypothetical protein KKD03_01885 [Patescibacteria group bacterium]|nr:hypothetical protein [Patescibacteria group bacterium]